MVLYVEDWALFLVLLQDLGGDLVAEAAVLNAMYDLHASASGWMKFFNDTYGNEGLKLSQRHIWAAFTQESI